MRGLLSLLLLLGPAPAAAQREPPAAASAEERLLAVDAVARFRITTLHDSITRIDACSLRLLVGPALARRIDARTRRLYVSGTEPNGVCELNAVARNRSRRLLLESVAAAGDSLVLRAAFVDGHLQHTEEYVVRRAGTPAVVSQRLFEFIVADPPPPVPR